MLSVMEKTTNRTKRIGVRVHEDVFNRLRQFSINEEKTIGEWCSERLTELAWGFVTPFAKALLAEMAASQDITVQILFAIATQGRLTREKVTEITAAAHEAKFEEAEELLKCAYNRTGRVHLPISYSAAKGERR